MSEACPCGSGLAYAVCCGRYHDGEMAPTAEALMRSRYSAFVRAKADYLLATWHPDTRPPNLDFEADCKWLGLEIRRQQILDAQHALVEFVARWRVQGRGQRLHETSTFERDAAGRWYYVDGEIHAK